MNTNKIDDNFLRFTAASVLLTRDCSGLDIGTSSGVYKPRLWKGQHLKERMNGKKRKKERKDGHCIVIITLLPSCYKLNAPLL